MTCNRCGSQTSCACVGKGDYFRYEGGCTGQYTPQDLRYCRCYVCGEAGHLCCKPTPRNPPFNTSCYFCGSTDHAGEECPSDDRAHLKAERAGDVRRAELEREKELALERDRYGNNARDPGSFDRRGAGGANMTRSTTVIPNRRSHYRWNDDDQLATPTYGNRDFDGFRSAQRPLQDVGGFNSMVPGRAQQQISGAAPPPHSQHNSRQPFLLQPQQNSQSLFQDVQMYGNTTGAHAAPYSVQRQDSNDMQRSHSFGNVSQQQRFGDALYPYSRGTNGSALPRTESQGTERSYSSGGAPSHVYNMLQQQLRQQQQQQQQQPRWGDGVSADRYGSTGVANNVMYGGPAQTSPYEYGRSRQATTQQQQKARYESQQMHSHFDTAYGGQEGRGAVASLKRSRYSEDDLDAYDPTESRWENQPQQYRRARR